MSVSKRQRGSRYFKGRGLPKGVINYSDCGLLIFGTNSSDHFVFNEFKGLLGLLDEHNEEQMNVEESEEAEDGETKKINTLRSRKYRFSSMTRGILHVTWSPTEDIDPVDLVIRICQLVKQNDLKVEKFTKIVPFSLACSAKRPNIETPLRRLIEKKDNKLKIDKNDVILGLRNNSGLSKSQVIEDVIEICKGDDDDETMESKDVLLVEILGSTCCISVCPKAKYEELHGFNLHVIMKEKKGVTAIEPKHARAMTERNNDRRENPVPVWEEEDEQIQPKPAPEP